MPSAPPPMRFDGWTTAEAGMNEGAAGARLPANEVALLINGTVRGEYLRQRPGFRRVLQVTTEPGFFQHGGWLRTRSGQVFLVAVVGGRFFRVDPLAKYTTEFTIAGDPNPSTLTEGWSMPGGAEGYWIYQDGQTQPLIWDGAGAYRAARHQIKVGKAMAYVAGRIWYSLPDGLQFRAGDIVGNADSGDPIRQFKDSILWETENTYLATAGNFSVPADTGGIKAMAATNQEDTSLGQGPLQVFCEKAAFSCNAPVEREQWQNVTYPIETRSLIGSGFSSAQSVQHINGDLFGRASDGIRSFMVGRRDFHTWGNTAQSFEVSQTMDADQPDLLNHASAALFDKRYLLTCSPAWTDRGVYHRGLVALDTSPLSNLGRPKDPVYDGIWTGLKVLTVLRTDVGCYLFVLADDGSIELWELTKDALFDDETVRVTWTVIPRTFFVDQDALARPLWQLKRLETGDLFYDQLAGNVHFSLSWKPDAYPCFTVWKDWEECTPVCGPPACPPAPSFQLGFRPRMRLPTPPDECVAGTTLPLRNFYQLGVKLDITGPARLIGARFGAIPQGEPVYDPNCDRPECVALQCCDFDLFAYDATEGGGSSGSSGSGSGSGEDSGGSGSGGSGGGGGRGGGDVDTPDETAAGGGFPTVDAYPDFFIFDTGYAIESNNPDYPTNVTGGQAAFWATLAANDWATNGPGTYSERHLAWWFPNHSASYYDFIARFTDGSPFPDNTDPFPEFSAPWLLVYVYRP